MLKLYSDKPNIFECNIDIEGATLSNSFARLIIETKDVNLMFNGTINKQGKCTININKIKSLLGENKSGNAKLEVIADDTYFTPWSSEYEIVASKKVTVEVINNAPAHNMKRINEDKLNVSVNQSRLNLDDNKIKHIVELFKKHNITIAEIKSDQKIKNIIIEYIRKNNITDSKYFMRQVINEIKK